MLRLLLFFAGLIILVVPEFLKVYYIMPFPGSQEDETIRTAYMLHNYIWLFRVLGFALIAWPAWNYIRSKNIWVKWPTIVAIGIWLFIVYTTTSVMLADKMFVQPKHKVLATVDANKIPANDLVIGVSIDGESKAYPIEIIGYHHQVRDSLAGKPIMVTYCTVCRTGRVYSPVVDGVEEQFRLVGMDHYNAMFEDSRTKSWWRQVNGEAIVGELKGKRLADIPSEQMRLSAWIAAHPNTKILQRDDDFKAQYDSLALYDEGKMTGRLEGTDTMPWKEKSWVIGVESHESMEAWDWREKAYDWTETLKVHVVNDTIRNARYAVVIAIEPDNASFHAWYRPWYSSGDGHYTFKYDNGVLKDVETNSTWNWQGKCVEGELKDKQMERLQAYQEYWMSWRTFRPYTTQYRPDGR